MVKSMYDLVCYNEQSMGWEVRLSQTPSMFQTEGRCRPLSSAPSSPQHIPWSEPWWEWSHVSLTTGGEGSCTRSPVTTATMCTWISCHICFQKHVPTFLAKHDCISNMCPGLIVGLDQLSIVTKRCVIGTKIYEWVSVFLFLAWALMFTKGFICCSKADSQIYSL